MRWIILAGALALAVGGSTAAASAGPGHALRTGSYDSAVLADSPQAYYALTSTTGTETDLTGHGYTGTYHHGVGTQAVLPNGAHANSFNGTSQYLTVASTADLSIPATGSFTWEAWLRPAVANFPVNNGGYVNWLNKCTSGACEFEGRMYDQNTSRPSRLSAYAFNPSGGLGSGAYWQESSTSQISAGQWLYVVGEYTTTATPSWCDPAYPGSVTIYVDGVPWNDSVHGTTGCLSQYAVTPTAGQAPIDVGADLASYFKGSIGKLAFYGYRLSAAQVATHWTTMTGLPVQGSCASTCTLGSAARALRVPATLTGHHICESGGNHYCIGAHRLRHGFLVREAKPGRDMTFKQDGHTFRTFPTGVLKFTGATNSCAIANPADAASAVTGPCAGVNGTRWARVTTKAGHHKYINIYDTQHSCNGSNCFLGGFSNGTPFVISGASPGLFEQFNG